MELKQDPSIRRQSITRPGKGRLQRKSGLDPLDLKDLVVEISSDRFHTDPNHLFPKKTVG
jgi:hypothetical protein